MTLADWTALTGVLPTHPTTERGAVSVVMGPNEPHVAELWHLADYAVSSRCGAVVWLVPKRTESAE
jgi:hypothetical protein